MTTEIRGKTIDFLKNRILNAVSELGLNIHESSAKTTPVNADEIPVADSAASWVLKRVSIANLKTLFWTSPTLITPALGTPASGDASNLTNFPTLNQNTTGSAATLTTPRTINGVSFNGSANITTIAEGTHAATGKTTPVDADELALVDSAASNVLKKLTWANLKATAKTYFDTLYQPLDTDLTTIAGLTATTDNFLVAASSAWASRTPSQAKTSLALTKTDVGLSNVDNTSNATERAATRTITNARVTPRTGTATSSATPTINTDNVDFYSLTALAVDITSFTTNLSGTPTDGQKLWLAITGTATRTITWGASFEASTVALPTATSGTSRLDIGFIWNAATSKWRCIGSA